MDSLDTRKLALLKSRRFKEPAEWQIKRAAAFLSQRGWHENIAGEENFRKGAKAYATSAINRMGLFISGEPGTGKTRYLEAVTQRFEEMDQLVVIRLKDSANADRIDRFKNPDGFDLAMEKHVFIDDLGAELRGNNFGILYEPVMDFILAYLERGKGSLFTNTNRTPGAHRTLHGANRRPERASSSGQVQRERSKRMGKVIRKLDPRSYE